MFYLMNTNKPNATKQAEEFLAVARKYGFKVQIAGDSVVRIVRHITVGSLDEFCEADSMYNDVLAYAPLKNGSVWGTDGGSVGGQAAVNSGVFVMNKSGNGSRFMKALAKLVSQ